MKIEAIYNIDEPANLESDHFEVRVLIKSNQGEHEREYAFCAITIKFMIDCMAKENKSYFCLGDVAPLLVVPRLDHETIQRAIEDLLPEIDKLGYRTE